MARKGSPLPDAAKAVDETSQDEQVIIAIEPLNCEALALPAGSRIVKIPFRALTKPFLVETRSVLVLGPLVSPQLDAMQIAERLGELGFQGTFRLVGPPLPNPNLVLREVRAATGSKDIQIEVVTES